MTNWLKSDGWTRTVGEMLKMMGDKIINTKQVEKCLDLVESFHKTKCPPPSYIGIECGSLLLQFSAEDGVFWQITIDKEAKCGIITLPRRERKKIIDSISKATEKENAND